MIEDVTTHQEVNLRIASHEAGSGPLDNGVFMGCLSICDQNPG